MTEAPNPFTRLSAINVSDHIERKGGFAYLSWPYAVAELRQADPLAHWEVRRFNDLPYLATEMGYFVEVAVTVQGLTLSQIHPVLDGRNRPILNPTPFDINTSIQRCLVKAIALHGLGLYIYAGEDMPPPNEGGTPEQPPAAPPSRPKAASSKLCIDPVQQRAIRRLAAEVGVELPKVLEYFGASELSEIAVADYLRVIRSLEKRRATA